MTTRLEVQARDMATQIRVLLDAVGRGDLAASTAMTYRMQGAVVALDALLGDESPLLESFNVDPPTSFID